MRKRKNYAVAKLLASAQDSVGALRALTTLAEAARHAADLGMQLQAMAADVEEQIDRLAPCVGCTVDDVYAPLFREIENGANDEQ
jgi:predicted Rossmann fold nucleotide-binding protein DprA/Smf involved in DNA uptake